jgi:hypothetical protein
MLSVNPDAATRDDVARLAAELMEANHARQELREVVLPFVLHARAFIEAAPCIRDFGLVLHKCGHSYLTAGAFYQAEEVYRETAKDAAE